MEIKYYECHVTTDPPQNEKAFIDLCTQHGFRPATLYKENGALHGLDAFTTKRDSDLERLNASMGAFTWDLNVAGINWRRRKIEAILYDERTGVHG